ncbi:hypothetical protein QFZ40_003005 [Arthrobacter pascens]|nr:hypothetical protein [Arthrobacter pascens]
MPRAAGVLGETDVGINRLWRAVGVPVLAAAALVLAPGPAHAEYVCWMSDGIKYCYDPGDRQVPDEPTPAPIVEPPYTPPEPGPPGEQPGAASAPAPAVPVEPAPVHPITAPVNEGPAPIPAPVRPVPVPVYAPPQRSGYHAPAAEPPVASADARGEAAPSLAPSPPEPASPVEDAQAMAATASVGPTSSAATSSSASMAPKVATDQASSADSSSPLPLMTGVGFLAASAAAWFVIRHRQPRGGRLPQ